MLTMAYYFLKVILCSGIMLLYYWMVLRNKRFHQYNRFYLLFVGLFSWLIPLIKIPFAQPAGVEQTPIIQLANIVADNNSEFEHIVLQKGFTVNWDALAVVVYALVSAFFLVTFIAAIVKVYRLLKTNSCKNIGDVYLILTNAKGTPFSFFKYIFWNEAIDINTSTGKQMMQHELIHVQEKHSADKLFMQLVILFGWFNPFFWLAKKELNMIHEFIADNKAIENGDTASLATMLLTAAYPQQQYLLSNPFFFSPIKRRLAMLTNTKNPRWSYARRLVILPLLATVVLLFAFRKKDAEKKLPLGKVYTVVIDAGHGGTDNGVSVDGTTEKELNLLMLKAIKAANTNDKIKLLFTRETDVFQNPMIKANFVNEQKADLFISLHTNWAPKKDSKVNGIEIYIPNNADRKNIEQCKSFATAINQSLQESFISNGVRARSKGIWVLQATECPAALIECGFISNAKDLAMLKNETKRKKMAELILIGIGNYLKAVETNGDNALSFGKDEMIKADFFDTLFTNSNQQRQEEIVKEVNFKGEKLISLQYKSGTNPHIFLSSKKHKWNINLEDIALMLEKLEPLKDEKMAEHKNLIALYKVCLKKKEETELIEANKNRRSKTNTAQLIVRDKDGEIHVVRKGNDTIKPKKDTRISVKPATTLNWVQETKSNFNVINASQMSIAKDSKEVSLLNAKVKSVNLFNDYTITADTLIVDNPQLMKLNKDDYLVILDGQRMDVDDAKEYLKQNSIQMYGVFSSRQKLEQYKATDKKGVIFITTKKKQPPVSLFSPLNNSYVAEGFGRNIHESKIAFQNDGVLIKSKSDFNVKSVAKGTVSYTGNVGGENVIIVKGEEYFYSYSKLNDLKVKRGDAVTKGDILATASNEDNESTVMLMVTDNKGKPLNPASVLSSK